MVRSWAIAVAALLLFSGALSLRLCHAPRAKPPRRIPLEIPALPALDLEEAPRKRAAAPPPEVPSPARLRAFLERLGRAGLLRDRRTLDLLRREMPPVFESDFEPLWASLGGDLFLDAGVAQLARLFGRPDAVGPLAQALGRPGHAYLKDLLIETLAALGGDAAEAALLQALRGDEDDSIRFRAAEALPAFQGPEVYRSLILALRDPSVRVRSAAAGALGRMGSREVVQSLLGSLREEGDPEAQANLAVAALAAGGDRARDSVLQLIDERPAAAEILRTRIRTRDDARYRRGYDRAFFEPGGAPIPFDPSRRRVGITLEAGSSVSPREVGMLLFGTAPLDRYRDWFFIRKADDFPALTAYDASGNPMEPVPYGELEGTVFLHFKDPASFARGVLGYTTGCHAFVQGASLLHEFGHAFAHLGDEYRDGSRAPAANLSRGKSVPWMPLIGAGLLEGPLPRDGEFFIPSDNCYLNNTPAQNRYCPVCQLEIHARMAERAGAPLPW